MNLYDAIDHVKQEIKAGFVMSYHVDNGKLDVLTDQGWQQWYPLPNDSYSGSNDSLGD